MDVHEPKEAAPTWIKKDYSLFVASREDALRLLRMTENGDEQVGTLLYLNKCLNKYISNAKMDTKIEMAYVMAYVLINFHSKKHSFY